MLPEHVLLVLPIHRRTEQKYKSDHEEYYERKTREQKNPKTPWRIQERHWRSTFSWGRWLHNDVIGYLEIGWDGANRLGGYVFLRWQQLKRRVKRQTALGVRETGGNPVLTWHRLLAKGCRSRNEVVPECEIALGWVDITNNKSCVDAVVGIVEDARRYIRKRFRSAEVWLPPFGLECIDWVEAIRQAKERTDTSD